MDFTGTMGEMYNGRPMGRPGGRGMQGDQSARHALGDDLYQQFIGGDDAARWDMLNGPGTLGRGGTLSALRGGFMRATGQDPLAFNAQINRFGGGARPDGGQSAMPTGQGSMTPQMLAAALRGSAGAGGLGGSPGGGQFSGLNRQMYPVAPPMRGMPNRNTGMFLGAGGQFTNGLPTSAY